MWGSFLSSTLHFQMVTTTSAADMVELTRVMSTVIPALNSWQTPLPHPQQLDENLPLPALENASTADSTA